MPGSGTPWAIWSRFWIASRRKAGVLSVAGGGDDVVAVVLASRAGFGLTAGLLGVCWAWATCGLGFSGSGGRWGPECATGGVDVSCSFCCCCRRSLRSSGVSQAFSWWRRPPMQMSLRTAGCMRESKVTACGSFLRGRATTCSVSSRSSSTSFSSDGSAGGGVCVELAGATGSSLARNLGKTIVLSVSARASAWTAGSFLRLARLGFFFGTSGGTFLLSGMVMASVCSVIPGGAGARAAVAIAVAIASVLVRSADREGRICAKDGEHEKQRRW